MKEEDKELLLQDLCARLPYGVKGFRKWTAPLSGSPEEFIMEFSTFDIIALTTKYIEHNGKYYEIRNYSFKPYLFPLSSMTEEQKKEYHNLCNEVSQYEHIIGEYIISYEDTWKSIDWLNKNHFDYRGLIEKGLAIDATGLNIY